MMCGHEWKETGEQGAHIDFKYQGASGRHRHARVFAIYVRCAYCGQQGFRRSGAASFILGAKTAKIPLDATSSRCGLN